MRLGSDPTPSAIFGGNFQYISIAQKTVEYNNDSSISAGVLQAMNFMDSSLGQIVAKLKAKGYYQDTLIPCKQARTGAY